jgi:pimeloyl-ACP methyl ester carboxylesterase
MRVVLLLAAALCAGAQESVSLRTSDDALIRGDLYGSGRRGVVLAHGGRFNRQSWAVQARELAAAGYRVLAIDFRGYGTSRGPADDGLTEAPYHLDVLAAVRYLRSHGARTVSVIGGSFGGAAAGGASIASRPGEIDRVVILGASPDGPAEKLHSRSLFLVARDDSNGAGPRLPEIQAAYDKAPQPKELIVLEGSAHAQYLFRTDQGPRVMREILRFLAAP